MKLRNKKGTHHSKEQFRLALEKAGGLVTHAAALLGCTDKTVYNAMARWPDLRDVCVTARDKMVDDAERCIRDKVLAGDTTAAIFTLKTLGKYRGFIEKLVVQAQPVDVGEIMAEAERSAELEIGKYRDGQPALCAAGESSAAGVVSDSGRGTAGGVGE